MEDQIDRMLADGLKGRSLSWPGAWAAPEHFELMLRRINYHGVAGLLAQRPERLIDWPDAVTQPIREQAVAQAMWELRHRATLSELLAAFAGAGIVAVLLKGTALAYDLYPVPATRSRGDSDILIAPDDLGQARAILRRLGFRGQAPEHGAIDDFALQEVWSHIGDNRMEHHVDLHWQLLNAPALRNILPFSECTSELVALPRLSPHAWSMDRVRTLVHTCIHRTMHITAPYFVDGLTYHGGNRLIWIQDIHLLAEALTDAQWADFFVLVRHKGVAAVCLDGLVAAQQLLGTRLPHRIGEQLASGPRSARASNYLLGSRQLGRAWLDLLAIRGIRRKLTYLKARMLPSAAFIRKKYPRMAGAPLVLLHVRRMAGLLRARADGSDRR